METFSTRGDSKSEASQPRLRRFVVLFVSPCGDEPTGDGRQVGRTPASLDGRPAPG
ncbi:MAG: hypothetical protein IJ684_01445 [Bacteroidales bacterium]|nr:hypothetical protein [Bacteroidales bacterium]